MVEGEKRWQVWRGVSSYVGVFSSLAWRQKVKPSCSELGKSCSDTPREFALTRTGNLHRFIRWGVLGGRVGS